MNQNIRKHRFRTRRFKFTRSSNNKRIRKLPKKRCKRKPKEKRCICIPQHGLVEFPAVWTELRNNDQLCDGIIICEDGVELKVHRAILSAVSSYFKAHFTNILNGGVPENVQAKVNVTSNIFKKILDFAYTGHCKIEESTVEVLLRTADQYHVLGVIQLCCQYILELLQPTNCLGILRFARHYFCCELEKKGKRYIMDNFVSLIKEGSEFQHLTVKEVLEILGDDHLNVNNEEIVFEAIKKWINENVNQRKVHIFELLKCVRLRKLSVEFISAEMLQWEVIKNNQESQEYAMKLLAAVQSKEKIADDTNSYLTRPRVPYDVIFAIGGWSAGSPTNFVETYDSRAEKWLLSVDTDCVPRAYHGMCALKGYIYMIGGFDGNEHFNSVRRFDPINHKWKECACMYYPRCYVSVVMYDNKIYAMGGYNGRTRMNSAERYDPDINQWELIRPMQRQRSDASAAVLNNKIYIVGGFNGHEVMSSAEVYDPSADQWTFIPHMFSARSGVSLIAFRDTLYALGGFNGYTRLTSGERFKPGTTAGWMKIHDMFNPRSNFATAILDGKIYAIGGFNGSTTINFVEYYDSNTNEWCNTHTMNLNRSALSSCVLSGLPNAFDYSYLSKRGKGAGQEAKAPRERA